MMRKSLVQNTFEYINMNDWKSEISSDEDYSDSYQGSSENVEFRPVSTYATGQGPIVAAKKPIHIGLANKDKNSFFADHFSLVAKRRFQKSSFEELPDLSLFESPNKLKPGLGARDVKTESFDNRGGSQQAMGNSLRVIMPFNKLTAKGSKISKSTPMNQQTSFISHVDGSLKQDYTTEDYPSRKSLSKSKFKKSEDYNNPKANKQAHFIDLTESRVPSTSTKKIVKNGNGKHLMLGRTRSESKLFDSEPKFDKSEPQKESKHKAGHSISVFPNYPAKLSRHSSTINAKTSMDNLGHFFAHSRKKNSKLPQNKTIEAHTTLPTSLEPQLFIGRHQKKVPSPLTASQGIGVSDTNYFLRNSFQQSYKKYVVNSPLSTFIKK